MTITSAAALIALDDDDQQPVWTYAPGEAIADGLRAWQPLGVGHRCETWLAWSSSLWSPVVVKLARPHQVNHPRAIRSLEREVAALGGLFHPNLPRLIRAAIYQPVPHIVAEYVDGLALDDELEDRGSLDDESVALLGAQLLAALVPIHRRGLAHLDIKPENIMIRNGRPVLADFGSAREIGSRQPAGRPVGTLGWAAPEMETCQPIAAAMDIFGVGKVLAACFDNSRPPIQPPGRRLRELVAEMTTDDPALRPTLDQATSRIAVTVAAEHRPWPTWA
jgi:eukaryotic-like serine/threonine-protein kinase